jgi:hypothetical protein
VFGLARLFIALQRNKNYILYIRRRAATSSSSPSSPLPTSLSKSFSLCSCSTQIKLVAQKSFSLEANICNVLLAFMHMRPRDPTSQKASPASLRRCSIGPPFGTRQPQTFSNTPHALNRQRNSTGALLISFPAILL